MRYSAVDQITTHVHPIVRRIHPMYIYIGLMAIYTSDGWQQACMVFFRPLTTTFYLLVRCEAA